MAGTPPPQQGNVAIVGADGLSVAKISPDGAVSVSPVPAILQKAKAVSTGSVATLAATFTNNNAAGNTIVVVAGCGNGTAMTVADSAGNTYTSAVAAPNSTTFAAQIFYAPNILLTTTANVVTVTNAGSAASMAVEIYEVSGLLAQIGSLGQNTSGTGTSATPSVNNIAASTPNSLAFMGVAVGTAAQAASVTAGTNWVLDSTQNTTTPAGLYTFGAFSQSIDNVGPFAPKCTIAGSEPFAIAAAIFKPVTIAIAGTVHMAGYNYTRMTTQTTTQIKTGAGVLHAVIINKPLANGVVEMDDALSNTSPVIGLITLPATLLQDGPKMWGPADVMFSIGLSVTTSGATQDVTIVWR